MLFRKSSPESSAIMSAVMLVNAADSYGPLIIGNAEGGLRAPAAQVANETRAQAAQRLAWERRLGEAHQGRRALAGRYASCVVTEVVDTHAKGILRQAGAEHVPRNKVVVTIEAILTPESAAAEAKYANGTPIANDVVWERFDAGAEADTVRTSRSGERRRLPIPTQSKAQKTGPNTETFTVMFYPRLDERFRTTNAEVGLNTRVETWVEAGEPGMRDNRTYLDTGRVVCGTLTEVVQPSGATEWQPARGPFIGRAPEHTREICGYIPIGANTFDEACS